MSEEVDTMRLGNTTPESVAWAAANLEGLPTLISFSKSEVECIEVQGKQFRKAFTIATSPARDEPRFRLWLRKGGTGYDISRGKHVIKLMQQGSVDTWRHLKANEKWPHDRWVFDMYVQLDPKAALNEVRECADAFCTEPFHTWHNEEQDDPCMAESIDHPEGHYQVLINRYHGEEWMPFVSHSGEMVPEGPDGMPIIRDLARDYTSALAICEKYNMTGLKEAA